MRPIMLSLLLSVGLMLGFAVEASAQTTVEWTVLSAKINPKSKRAIKPKLKKGQRAVAAMMPVEDIFTLKKGQQVKIYTGKTHAAARKKLPRTVKKTNPVWIILNDNAGNERSAARTGTNPATRTKGLRKARRGTNPATRAKGPRKGKGTRAIQVDPLLDRPVRHKTNRQGVVIDNGSGMMRTLQSQRGPILLRVHNKHSKALRVQAKVLRSR